MVFLHYCVPHIIQSEHWWLCYVPGALCSCYSFLTSAVGQILWSPRLEARHWTISSPNGKALMKPWLLGKCQVFKNETLHQSKSALIQYPSGKKANCVSNLRAWFGMSAQVLDYHTHTGVSEVFFFNTCLILFLFYIPLLCLWKSTSLHTHTC